MVRAPQPDIVPSGWQLPLIDMLAQRGGGVEPKAQACRGLPHEGQTNAQHINIPHPNNTVHVSGVKEGRAVVM